ncbi:Phytocyanin domain containing protein [Parasponia andersonii]|uniref:Phytocyanin domain containing protein n=1 Tax=Parasponia andersonii TaxID=3476 RepID=A0A2P5CCN3_PARAD|nr:Phytocyanin domain containing protein [Parasponia andersonii]
MAAMATALLVLLLAAPAVRGAQYTVGDTAGWNSGVDYTAWTSDKTFTVGDTLVFNYDTSHKVDEVNQNDYKSCSTSNVLKSHGGTTVTITLSTSGSVYFICPTPGHCDNGMKLQVDVKASSTPGGSPPSTPSPPSGSPSTPGTPPATTTPSTNQPPSPTSGAASIVANMNVLGVSVVLATLLVAFRG